MSSATVTTASIINLDSGGPAIPCMFNPTDYTFTKQNSWHQGQSKGSNVPPIEFASGQPTTLTLKLLFDTYGKAKDSGSSEKDVRKAYTNAIWALMSVDDSLKDAKNKKGRPPKVRFQWGQSWSFDAAITNITQKILLFEPEGTPVRATLDVTFMQVRDESLYPSQNPTSGGQGGERVVTVKEGDTLAGLAYQHYGDCASWRLIADENRLTQVRSLRPGLQLVIPNV